MALGCGREASTILKIKRPLGNGRVGIGNVNSCYTPGSDPSKSVTPFLSTLLCLDVGHQGLELLRGPQRAYAVVAGEDHAHLYIGQTMQICAIKKCTDTFAVEVASSFT